MFFWFSRPWTISGGMSSCPLYSVGGSHRWWCFGPLGVAKILPFLCLKLCILLELFDSFLFKNLAPGWFCKNFVSVGFIPIGWSARTGRETPGRQDGGVGGTGCKAPNHEPRPPARVTKRCAPEETPKGGPLGGKAGPTPRPNPGRTFWYFPSREVPPAVLLAQFRLILPEATAMGVRLSHASHGARSARTGGRLSNTSVTYPREGDNPGKLGLIPHRPEVLEGPQAERVSDRPRMGRRPIR